MSVFISVGHASERRLPTIEPCFCGVKHLPYLRTGDSCHVENRPVSQRSRRVQIRSDSDSGMSDWAAPDRIKGQMAGQDRGRIGSMEFCNITPLLRSLLRKRSGLRTRVGHRCLAWVR
jgi:hypothetical protein